MREGRGGQRQLAKLGERRRERAARKRAARAARERVSGGAFSRSGRCVDPRVVLLRRPSRRSLGYPGGVPRGCWARAALARRRRPVHRMANPLQPSRSTPESPVKSPLAPVAQHAPVRDPADRLHGYKVALCLRIPARPTATLPCLALLTPPFARTCQTALLIALISHIFLYASYVFSASSAPAPAVLSYSDGVLV